MDIINNCRQYFVVKLPSTLWSDRVKRFEKKFAECDNIFLQNSSLSSIVYIYLLVKFLFCLFFCFFFMFICYQLWWIKMYNTKYRELQSDVGWTATLCIRTVEQCALMFDRRTAVSRWNSAALGRFYAVDLRDRRHRYSAGSDAVSYTHLTLPTILRV